MKTDYLKDVKEIVNKDKKDLFINTSKASIHGAVTGLVIGLMLGYYKKMNVYSSGLIGAVVGGLATAVIVNKK